MSTTLPAGTGGAPQWMMGSGAAHSHDHHHEHSADGSCCGHDDSHDHHHAHETAVEEEEECDEDHTNPSGGCGCC